jgi:hypothetical protein
LKPFATGRLEGDFLGVYRVLLAVVDDGLDANHRVTGHRTGFQRLAAALFP